MALKDLTREELERLLGLVWNTTDVEAEKVVPRKTKKEPNPQPYYVLKWLSPYGYEAATEYTPITEEEYQIFQKYSREDGTIHTPESKESK
jgi:hypothetical protein